MRSKIEDAGSTKKRSDQKPYPGQTKNRSTNKTLSSKQCENRFHLKTLNAANIHREDLQPFKTLGHMVCISINAT